MPIKTNNSSIHYGLLILALLMSCGLAVAGLFRLDVDTDVIHSLPADKGIISDALQVFANHPMLKQIAVDIRINRDDPDALVACGKFVEQQFRASRLFSQVGTEEIGDLIPGLAQHVAENLPVLFSAAELQQQVAPHLTAKAVEQRVSGLFSDLSSMQGIGQARFAGVDPLGLKNLVLARMALLAPSFSSRFYKGMLLSADGRHLLVTARPAAAGTDTGAARRILSLFQDISRQLSQKYEPAGLEVTLTPVGAFRAALDNETIIRRDVRKAIILAMAGIGLLLLFSFPRPFIGLLSLIPALAGTAVALFVYSLFHSAISIIVLGFGGAVISITVDHGIAYLLFLDRPHATRGSYAATEVRAVGLMAVFTTIGAFLALCFSGFPMFIELGQFTALGVLFSFLFVHLVFPRVFPDMPPGSGRVPLLQKLVDLGAGTGWTGAISASGLALFLLFFASPSFDVGLNTMNTVSRETMAADKLFSETWGNPGNRIFLMTTGAGIDEIVQADELLLPEIAEDVDSGVLGAAFVSSMLFPGEKIAKENYKAWQEFWTEEKASALKKNLDQVALPLGFSPQAFASFYTFLAPDYKPTTARIDPKYFALLGISERHDGDGLVRFITFEPGPHYDPAVFYEKYAQFGRIYDGGYFSQRLGNLLFATFSKMLLIIGMSITVMLLFFYLDLRLTLVTLTPVLFAYICTLGTLHLMGRSLDIPSLMLSIVILGMGIDYSIFFVRAHQRFRDPFHPSFSLVRMAVFMAAASTLIGFGVLAGAEHSLLHSIGITCLLGIGYSLLGAFLLLPPLLTWLFSEKDACRCAGINERVRHRFRLFEAYPRMFARFKLKFDPLFSELPSIVDDPAAVKTILDIGCGYGVPAAWCLEYFPEAFLAGLEPDPERVRVASLVIGDRGKVFKGCAPELPQIERSADLILLLDMLHYLDDETLQKLFRNCCQAAGPEAVLVARYSVKPDSKRSWLWHLEQYRIRLARMTGFYRTPEEVEAMVKKAGFTVEVNRVTPGNPELFWLKGRIRR